MARVILHKLCLYYIRVVRENHISFSDAEGGEDGVEEVVGGDGAGYGAEVVEGFPYVLGYEVSGESGLYAFNRSCQCVGSPCQCFVVAGVGHYQFRVGIDVSKGQIVQT